MDFHDLEPCLVGDHTELVHPVGDVTAKAVDVVDDEADGEERGHYSEDGRGAGHADCEGHLKGDSKM